MTPHADMPTGGLPRRGFIAGAMAWGMATMVKPLQGQSEGGT